MTASRYDRPVGHDLPKPAMSPAKLEAAIATARARVEAHRGSRPGHTDIPALTAWAQEHETLTSRVELLEGQRALNWRDIPTPTETPMPRATNPHDQLTNLVDLYRRNLAAAKEDSSQRKNTQTVRWRIKQLVEQHHLVAPVLESLPPLPGQAPKVPLPVANEPLEKAGEGPYLYPTPEQILALLPPQDAAPIGERLAVKVQPSEALQEHLAQFIADARALLPAWVPLVQAELLRARAKFPGAEHRTLALMEEAGEVVKAALDLHNRKPGATREALHAEIIQTMAMCVRLYEEGDPGVLGEGAA